MFFDPTGRTFVCHPFVFLFPYLKIYNFYPLQVSSFLFFRHWTLVLTWFLAVLFLVALRLSPLFSLSKNFDFPYAHLGPSFPFFSTVNSILLDPTCRTIFVSSYLHSIFLHLKMFFFLPLLGLPPLFCLYKNYSFPPLLVFRVEKTKSLLTLFSNPTCRTIFVSFCLPSIFLHLKIFFFPSNSRVYLPLFFQTWTLILTLFSSPGHLPYFFSFSFISFMLSLLSTYKKFPLFPLI